MGAAQLRPGKKDCEYRYDPRGEGPANGVTAIATPTAASAITTTISHFRTDPIVGPTGIELPSFS